MSDLKSICINAEQTSSPQINQHHFENPSDHLKDYDDLEDALRYLNALIIPLITTDFIEEVDINSIKAYIFCVQEKIEQAIAASKKIAGWTSGSE